MGSDPPTAVAAAPRASFQFALPRGERHDRHGGRRQIGGFNSRSRVGSDPDRAADEPRSGRFNSRSRVGSDLNQGGLADMLAVSIRAPAWGATRVFGGETRGKGFNSRSRVGSDAIHGRPLRRQTVSIRAPAWGATSSPRNAGFHLGVSIRAPAWGATKLLILTGSAEWFQFALPRGERRHHLAHLQRLPRFNSRSRVGSDDGQRPIPRQHVVSIRAPAWGATKIQRGARR